jgi:hypothetical protein
LLVGFTLFTLATHHNTHHNVHHTIFSVPVASSHLSNNVFRFACAIHSQAPTAVLVNNQAQAVNGAAIIDQAVPRAALYTCHHTLPAVVFLSPTHKY